MRKKLKFLWIIALIAVIGLGFTACGNDDDEGWTAEYAVGDEGPAGGTIFYVADGKEGRPLGFTVQGYSGATGTFPSYKAHYLEAAPANEGSNIKWSDDLTVIANVTTFNTIADSKVSQIGNGRKDTRIINDFLNEKGEDLTAAQRCATKTVTVGTTTFNDWFLPSIGELNELYKAIGEPKVPTTGYFWSSSQCSNDRAWLQDLDNGFQYNVNKDNASVSVRAIRAF